jgi:hypothetical protein
MKMNSIFLKSIFLLPVVWLFVVQFVFADDENDSSSEVEKTESEEGISPSAFENFKLILDRNIFDPERRAPRERDREPRPEPPREESFTLLGTMSYADKQVAFFKGTESAWSGAVKLGESVAKHKITGVAYEKVLLEYDGETVELMIGKSRSRRGDEKWETNDQEISTASRSDSSDGESSEDDGSPDLSELESNDILKQLMERRKQQMGQ